MSLDELEKFFKKGQDVKLSETKKHAINEELLSFMKQHPFVGGAPLRQWNGFSVPGFALFRSTTANLVFASMMIFLLVGGATSVGANSALPGDLLYPVKLGFNENVKQVLAFSDEAKLEVHIELAKTRLHEAEKLAIKGKINQSNETEISNNFKKHADKVSKYITKMGATKTSEESATAAAGFEASLRAHKLIIDQLQQNNHDQDESQLIETINDATIEVFDARTQFNNDSSSELKSLQKAKKAKLNEIKASVNKIKKLIKNKNNNISSDAILQSENNLNLIQETIGQANSDHSPDSDSIASSISSLQEALVIAQESEELLNAKTALGADFSIKINSDDNGSNNDTNTQDTDVNVELP